VRVPDHDLAVVDDRGDRCASDDDQARSGFIERSSAFIFSLPSDRLRTTAPISPDSAEAMTASRSAMLFDELVRR
jgi:hypothetical protein